MLGLDSIQRIQVLPEEIRIVGMYGQFPMYSYFYLL